MNDHASTEGFTQSPWSTPALQRFRTACLARTIEGTNAGWQHVLIPLGFAFAAASCGDTEMADWSRRWVDYHLRVPVRVVPPGSDESLVLEQRLQGITLSTYCGQWAPLAVVSMVERGDDHSNDLRLSVIREMADYICDNAIRLASGLMAHGFWALQPWVDSLYYVCTPLALAFDVTKEERYAAEAVQQCLLHARYLRDDLTGCFFHDADLDRGTRSIWLWSRGNGWAIMALADVLRLCPRELPGWEEVKDIYCSMATGLLRMQHSSGLWRIIPDNPESHLETSGTTMIATGLAVGLAENWLERSVAFCLQRAWQELATWIDDEGRLLGSQTPAGIGGWERHKLSFMGETAYGTGSFLRLFAELRTACLI